MTISSRASHPAADDFIAATDVEVLSTQQVAEVRRVALARFDPARRLTRVTDPLPAGLSQSEGT